MHGFARGKLERCLFVHETQVVSHVDDPSICANHRHWINSGYTSQSWWQSREARRSTGAYLLCTLDSNTAVFKSLNAEDFAVKPTAMYVDGCLELVPVQNAEPIVTPLTEKKSANLHDETSACNQAEHALFRSVVG